MVSVTYIDSSDQSYDIKARSGDSLMEVAVINGVPGIEAICGGSCVCGTCHVHVDEQWMGRLGPRSPAETEIIEMSDHAQPNSRLSCQIRASDEIDGIVVRIPPSQP